MLADLHTPVGAYLRLRDMQPMSALMECSDYHDRATSRSFIGVEPMASISIGHGMCTMAYPDGGRKEAHMGPGYGIEQALREFVDSFRVEGEGSELCGLYGYTSFNAVRYTEGIDVKDVTQQRNDAPDLMYILYKVVVAFDHFDNTMTVVTLGNEADIDRVLKRMNKDCAGTYGFRTTGEAVPTLTDDEHRENIRRGIAHCMRGDVFQIVLSRRFVQPYEGDDFTLYRALRSVNPSPYLFISTSEDSGCSALRPKPTAASRAARHSSTPLPEQQGARATTPPTGSRPNNCAPTRRKTPST